jgi:hypothetical protein
MKIRWSCRPVGVLSTVHRKSGACAVWRCGETEAVSQHARTTRAVADGGAHIPRVPVNLPPKTMVQCAC